MLVAQQINNHLDENAIMRQRPINAKLLNFLQAAKQRRSFSRHRRHQRRETNINNNVDASQTYRCNFCQRHLTATQFTDHWHRCEHFTPDSLAILDSAGEREDASTSLKSYSGASSDSESSHSFKSDNDEMTDTIPASAMHVAKQPFIDTSPDTASSYGRYPMLYVDDDKLAADNDDDPFKVDAVRDMKRRGEFPCRLCPKVFRNLRALKGHARVHIAANRGAQTYECNICTFLTADKATVIRHIRNHNGDHPYKCQLCFSTFTTKANCERHLRNAHRKTSRDDIKQLLIDLSNKTSQPPPPPQFTRNEPLTFDDSLHKFLTVGAAGVAQLKATFRGYSDEKMTQKRSDTDDSGNSNDSNNNTNSVPNADVLSADYPLTPIAKQKFGSYSNFGVDGLLETRTSASKLAERRFYETTTFNNYNKMLPTLARDDGFVAGNVLVGRTEQDVDKPLDLSVDVLDLSKKERDKDSPDKPMIKSSRVKSQPALTKPSTNFGISSRQGFVIGSPMSALSPFYVPSVTKLKNTNPLVPSETPPLPPLIFGPFAENTQLSEQVEKKISVAAPVVASTMQKSTSKSSSVKMVMKDGVLVEKQKQRRYRTEKPFSCAYCAGRFTLRSNMDRHVKQQHPDFWRQCQRSGSSRSQRSKKVKDMSVVAAAESTISPQRENRDNADEISHTYDKLNQSSSSSNDGDDDSGPIAVKKLNLGATDKEDGDDDQQHLVIDDEAKEHQSNDSSQLTGQMAREIPTPDSANDVDSLSKNMSSRMFSPHYGSVDDGTTKPGDGSEEDEDGLVAGSSSEGNGSGEEENRHSTESDNSKNRNAEGVKKKKSAYSLAPNRVHCNFCYRSFPWASSLRRHTLTHTGQKPYKCSNCPLLFTTKSNCDRHFLRKHRSQLNNEQNTSAPVLTIPSSESPTTTSISPTIRNDATRTRSNSPSRNVSERPFKCTHCPTSKFPTFESLKKHIVDKHGTCERSVDKMEMVKSKSEDIADWSENNETKIITAGSPNVVVAADQLNIYGHASSDLPFKCHLCDRSFGDRQETLDHINDSHNAEYWHLIDKGALDWNVKPDEAINQDEAGSNNANSDENNADTNRVRFPDYSSRKVICAFCLRRFWSAEDLRRHMRTHTGERPFACDICQRRFTLKHSMLRHRRKHSNRERSTNSCENSPNSDEDEPSSPCNNVEKRNFDAITAFEKRDMKCNIDTKSDEFQTTPSQSRSIETKNIDIRPSNGKKTIKVTAEDDLNLIAELLNIDDKEVDEMLTSKSAEDVAKLLGVRK